MPPSVVACRISSYRPFEHRALEHLATLGVQYIETYAPPADQIAQRVAEWKRYGVQAGSLQAECDLSRADVADQIRSVMPACAASGCKRLLVSSRADQTPLETAYQRLREAGRVAAEHGVTIMVETHPDLATNADVAGRTIAAVAHPNVRLNYDPANIYFYNHDADAVRELRKIALLVAGVHLKDTNGAYRAWHFPALGEGVVDFDGIFTVLDQAGYDGPLTLEIEGIEGEPRTEELICGRIARSVAFLRERGRFV